MSSDYAVDPPTGTEKIDRSEPRRKDHYLFAPRQHVHVSGVAGVGMNAIAQVLLADGLRVTGSDRFADQGESLPVLEKLQALGLELVRQDGMAIGKETRGLIVSTAVEADNPERLAAAANKVQEFHRSDVLASFARRGPLVAVAGTSGKTTCTGMLAFVLTECGVPCNMVDGGSVVNWVEADAIGNVRLARATDPWVVEVDESDRSLLNFDPDFALMTTVAADHFDVETTIHLFQRFLTRIRSDIICTAEIREILGLVEDKRVKCVDVSYPPELRIPGRHNRFNAALCKAMAIRLGAEPAAADAALQRFRGMERRLEKVTPLDNAWTVYDDYGHNPEKIAAAMDAVSPANGRLCAIWRPHGFAPLRNNLNALADAIARSLRRDDVCYLLPVFFAGGTVQSDVNSAELQGLLAAAGCQAQVFATTSELEGAVRAWRSVGDVLLVMGARDPDLPRLARRLAIDE